MSDRAIERAEQVLGTRAAWGRVAYEGVAHAPASVTYPGIDAVGLRYTSVQDSGEHPSLSDRGSLANLVPLVMAALYEVGFAWEAGPLTTWSN